MNNIEFDKESNLYKWEIDYFDKMIHKAKTNNEREFFQALRFRHAHSYCIADDRLVDIADTDDHIYLFRLNMNEYELGHQKPDGTWDEEKHVMNIVEVMDINLKDAGYIQQDLTVLEWLRKNDYRFVHYDRED